MSSSEITKPGAAASERALASGTLAQLYWDQGHPARARAVCEELLARDPTHGYARVLLERLAVRPEAELEARFVSSTAAGIDIGVGELELRWAVPRALLDGYADPRVDLVIAISRESERGATALRYTSLRCRDLRDERRFEVPLGPASAAIALALGSARRPRSNLVGVHERRPLRFIAVANPISW